jgi:hypothetical protein
MVVDKQWDFLGSNVQRVRFTGSDANDAFENDTARPSMAFGNGGQDVLIGGSGSDKLYGGSGDDRLTGGASDDYLDGGAGNDYLDGGAGNDGLFGGNDQARDTLIGNGGNDRLLEKVSYTNRILTRTDYIGGLTASDAVIQFADDEMTWTDQQIEAVDAAFSRLQNRTGGNTRILKDTKTSLPILFLKENTTHGWIGMNIDPVSFGRRIIEVVDFNTNTAAGLAQGESVVVHEIGHNWDDTAEGNPYAQSFAQLHTQSTQAGDYARSYGTTNAHEDWATCFEVEFGYTTQSQPTSIFRQKMALVDNFFDYLATHPTA